MKYSVLLFYKKISIVHKREGVGLRLENKLNLYHHLIHLGHHLHHPQFYDLDLAAVS